MEARWQRVVTERGLLSSVFEIISGNASENEGCQYLERDAAADKSGEACILLKKLLGAS